MTPPATTRRPSTTGRAIWRNTYSKLSPAAPAHKAYGSGLGPNFGDPPDGLLPASTDIHQASTWFLASPWGIWPAASGSTDAWDWTGRGQGPLLAFGPLDVPSTATISCPCRLLQLATETVSPRCPAGLY